MKNNLQVLIEELQKEHDYLTDEMNACIEEWDFESAEAYKAPLCYVSKQLKIAKNLENPGYNQLVSIRNRIEYYKKRLSKGEHTSFGYSYGEMEEEINKAEKRLSILNGNERSPYQETDELIKCLEKLKKEEISGFDLEIENEDILIIIEKKGASLHINITSPGIYLLDDMAGLYGMAYLKNIGFQVSENNAFKELTDFETIPNLAIITLLSRIIFDVFEMYGEKQAVIKVHTPPAN